MIKICQLKKHIQFIMSSRVSCSVKYKHSTLAPVITTKYVEITFLMDAMRFTFTRLSARFSSPFQLSLTGRQGTLFGVTKTMSSQYNRCFLLILVSQVVHMKFQAGDALEKLSNFLIQSTLLKMAADLPPQINLRSSITDCKRSYKTNETIQMGNGILNSTKKIIQNCPSTLRISNRPVAFWEKKPPKTTTTKKNGKKPIFLFFTYKLRFAFYLVIKAFGDVFTTKYLYINATYKSSQSFI